MHEKTEPTGLARFICFGSCKHSGRIFYGHQAGWAAGITIGMLIFAFAIGIWRRQIIKYPGDSWKAYP